MKLIPIGSKTPFGEVSAVHSVGGERLYFMVNKWCAVTRISEEDMFCKCGSNRKGKVKCLDCKWFIQ